MSATPISADFTPSILSDVELVEAQWDNTDTLIVKIRPNQSSLCKGSQLY